MVAVMAVVMAVVIVAVDPELAVVVDVPRSVAARSLGVPRQVL